jgi:putative tryptophan/tyrosine transport system substrate-binding protein
MPKIIRSSFNGGLIALFVLIFLAVSVIVGAAVSPAIVVVQSSDIRPFDEARAGFESTCGCTITDVIVTSSATANIAETVRGMEPDGVLAIGLDALMKVQTIRDIPMFYTMTASMSLPFQELKNLSGVSMFISPERQLRAIKETFPGAERVGLIYDDRNSASLVERAVRYANAHSIEIIAKKVSSSRDVLPLLDELKGKIDVFIMLPDVTVTNPETIESMLLFSFRNRVPLFTFSKKYVEMGALAALTVNPFDLGVQTGEIAHKILKSDARGGSMREFARTQILLINTKIAQKLGIVIPDAILEKSVKVK